MTLFYLYYNQPEAIKNLEKVGVPNYDCDKVIVDDGSYPPLKCDWATVYRIDEDVPWNQPAANNLGFSKIKESETILRMDIDHWIKHNDLLKIESLPHNHIIHFKRISHNNNGFIKELAPMMNIYLTNISTIKEVGGYDESFCGSYGYDDKELMWKLKKAGCVFEIHPEIKIQVNPVFSTDKLSRDIEVNKRKYNDLISSRKK